jgi:hypothetical protein
MVEPVFQALDMSQDPGSTFGNLLGGCISDSYEKKDRRALFESVLFLFLGAISSVVTTYFLSVLGVFV